MIRQPPQIPRQLLRRVKTPTLLQMEAVECGAAALGIVLRYYGHYASLEALRLECGVTRDGSNARNILRAAQHYGMEVQGLRRSSIESFQGLTLPFILHWNFSHFVVLEGFGRSGVYINDPATGPRMSTYAEFDGSFTGVVLVCKPGPTFEKVGAGFGMARGLLERLAGLQTGLIFVVLASLLLVIPGLIMPAFFRIFVDDILSNGRDWLMPLLIGMSVMALITALLIWLQQTALLRLQTKMAIRDSSLFFWHVLQLPITFFSQRSVGEIGYRVSINDRLAHLLSGEL
ncbi:MAG: NHLP family bacteriocin export ABC transporter peptidase/permease/ATPase, partial [Burkholderiales bacterium]|nr:NHLP family bacteriocin export ABC transporter peptidase/permease/ATPase [Anaerolineae bacterium]